LDYIPVEQIDMYIPFTAEQFLGVFEKYNLAIWPMQVIAHLLGIAAVLLAIKRIGYSDRIILAILSFYWLWMGVVYHLMFFSAINKAAYGFGFLFIIQGILFLWAGVVKPNMCFKFRPDIFSITGGLFVLYAMIFYPILGTLLGHGYPQSPCFGVAPCPDTIFTFGLLLWADRRLPKYILIMPSIWSIIGFGAVLSLGIREDMGLVIAGVLGTIMILYRDGKRQKYQRGLGTVNRSASGLASPWQS
jgi:hypothetical protein